MSDLLSLVEKLQRPSLLLRAARLGIKDYDRGRVLKRLTSTPKLPSPQRAVSTLLSVEEGLEEKRKSGDASYVPSRHVEVLIALLAELRLMVQPKLGV